MIDPYEREVKKDAAKELSGPLLTAIFEAVPPGTPTAVVVSAIGIAFGCVIAASAPSEADLRETLDNVTGLIRAIATDGFEK